MFLSALLEYDGQFFKNCFLQFFICDFMKCIMSSILNYDQILKVV